MPDFAHLHCHTQFSLLDGAASISNLYKKAVADGQKAIAITDHGNMFGVFNFVAEAAKHNKGEEKIKAIVGCEFYMVEDRTRKTFTKDDKDIRYHQLLLAKNAEGYKNLSKLCSLGYIEGMYSKWPRIDKGLIEKYHEGLIATSCCLGAIVPKTIMKKGEDEAEKELKWWMDLFGDDYYIELQRHGMAEQDKVNLVLMKFAKKYNLKMIATNDSHYVEKEDYNAHDILLCVNTGEKQSTPKMSDLDGDDDKFVKGKRFAFPNDNFYFKTKAEMTELFLDVPEAIDNTMDIVSKIEPLSLKKDILLPNFPIPPEFETQDDYLESLTWEGARRRYGEIDSEIEERLKFELFTIRTMGFAGYFLIVSDFIKEGRNLGVVVGPGRGSAAGSAVAYCIGITNIDPIKYDLLFERFLNPERKSMPDIDTDFDDEGRQKVIDYVVDKYGRNQVAQIVTYGKMAAKMSLKDVARVMDLSMDESNNITRLVPARPLGLTLKQVINAKIEGVKEEVLDVDDDEAGDIDDRDTILLRQEDIPGVMQLREWHHDKQNRREGEVLRQAMLLEGSVRNTGVHAAGIIIAPKDLSEIVPVAVAKDSNLLLTQFEGKVIEDAGVIKMDFLGLKTLSIIKTAMELIKKNRGVEIDIDNIPLDDTKTFELYQRAETTGTFQFESPGMQKYLRELKPDKFEDLIAMNALYRPGPMEYIPTYIKRKHGTEPVEYDIKELEEYLSDTYGITVYQEQVMLLSQSLAGFSKGKADSLRKAMGKKNLADLMKLKDDFMKGINEKGLDPVKCDKIWKDWEAFASYAFNKSHSTCYAFVAYQTGYLKAHYPAEYMAAVLSNNSSNIEKISLMMQECKRMGVPVLGPSVNESEQQFSVNSKGEIRFGLCAVKGVGEAPAINIIEERANGPYKNIFDLCARCNLRSVNKKTLEALVKGGGFDFDKSYHKAQYLLETDNGSGIELALRYGARTQESNSSNQASLFGESSVENYTEPVLPKVEEYSILEECNMEKEMVGIFINRHPMDTFKVEYHAITNASLLELENINELVKVKPNLVVAGIVVKVDNLMTKTGKNYSKFILQDYSGQYTFFAFGKTFDLLRLILYQNHFIVLRCRIERPQWQKEGGREWDLNILSGEKMEDVKDRYIKGISMNFDVKELSNGILENLEAIFNQFEGNSPVNITMIDKAKRHQFELYSSEKKVNVCSELLDELRRNDIDYQIMLKN